MSLNTTPEKDDGGERTEDYSDREMDIDCTTRMKQVVVTHVMSHPLFTQCDATAPLSLNLLQVQN